MGDWPIILTSVAVGIVLGQFVHPIRAIREWHRHNATLRSAALLAKRDRRARAVWVNDCSISTRRHTDWHDDPTAYSFGRRPPERIGSR